MRAFRSDRYGLGLPELRVRLLHLGLDLAALPDRDAHARAEAVRGERARHGVSDVAEVAAHAQRRQPLARGRAPLALRRLDARLRGLQVGARRVGARQRLLRRDPGGGREGHGVHEAIGLAERQADRTRERQLLLRGFVLRDDHPLALGCELHLRAQDVDAGREAGLLAVGGDVEERLGGGELGLRDRDAALPCHGLQVEAGAGQHHGVARAALLLLGGPREEALGLRVPQRVQVEDGLAGVGPRVDHVEGADQLRELAYAGEAKGGQAELLAHRGRARAHVRQQVRARLPVLARGLTRALLAEDQAEVVVETARDRLVERELQHVGDGRPRRHAAVERIRADALRGQRRGSRRQRERHHDEAPPHRHPSARFTKSTTNATSFSFGAWLQPITRRTIRPRVRSATA